MRNTALLSIALQPNSPDDARRLNQALEQLRADDPSIEVDVDRQTGQTILGAAHESHLEMLLDHLTRVFGVNAACGRPKVKYKEMLTESAAGQMKYANQSEGRWQYAHVKLRLSPGERGSGYVFDDTPSAGAIPKEFVPAIDEGVRQACEVGVVAGFPIVDVHVELYDGSYHDTDSTAFAFKIAGSMAFHDAAARAASVLLEPIMSLDVSVPMEHVKDVLSNLSVRRGRICEHEDRGATQVIRARVPLAELFGYESYLRAATQGRGTSSVEFVAYEPVLSGGNSNDDGSPVGVPKRPRPTIRDSAAAVEQREEDSEQN